MTKKSNIIKFPENRLKSSASHHEYYNEYDDFEEEWEIAHELREKEDYPALVKYCKQRAKRFPNNPYVQYDLGEAYVLNGEYEKAINFISGHHRKQPYNIDFQYVILDALFALGKNEDDFDWTQKPVILRMSNDILNDCYEFLKSKRKPRYLFEIHTEFVTKGYLLFTEEDLLKALLEDSRFIVDNTSSNLSAEVQVVRKGKQEKKITPNVCTKYKR
ncbi:MAG: hypothetical protein HYS70_02650 [Nitrospinae bacterium]|nr:hypothetical protein [Nitrospinota bacterium]